MRYQIIIEKEAESKYVAYSPVISSLRITGDSADDVLEALRQRLMCFVHDTEAQFEIIVRGNNDYHDVLPGQQAL
jgi:predicted RNase H-like HicB family nuclease